LFVSNPLQTPGTDISNTHPGQERPALVRNTTTNHVIAYRHLDDSGCGRNKPQQKDQALMTLTYKHSNSVLFKEKCFPADAAR
jgi:hypothetical protein